MAIAAIANNGRCGPGRCATRSVCEPGRCGVLTGPGLTVSNGATMELQWGCKGRGHCGLFACCWSFSLLLGPYRPLQRSHPRPPRLAAPPPCPPWLWGTCTPDLLDALLCVKSPPLRNRAWPPQNTTSRQTHTQPHQWPSSRANGSLSVASVRITHPQCPPELLCAAHHPFHG